MKFLRKALQIPANRSIQLPYFNFVERGEVNAEYYLLAPKQQDSPLNALGRNSHA